MELHTPGGPHWTSGIVQVVGSDGVLDLGPGLFDPALLPTGLLKAAYAETFARYGPAALAYGNNYGPLPLRAALAERTARADGLPCTPEQVVVTAGTSSALDLLARWLGRPGEAVLTEPLTYDLARRIFADRGLAVRGTPLDPDVLARAVAAEERRVAFLYVLPTFHNPTGAVMPLARRAELVEAACELGLLVVEDDAYAGLALDPVEAVPSLAGLAGYRNVIRLCTTSKSLAPGLRLGWLLTAAERATQLASSGMFTSGGGLNHLAALATATLLESGGYDRHVKWLREELRVRRDALLTPLRAGLPAFSFSAARGGFFVWGELPSGCTEAAALEAAAHARVRVFAGSRFGDTGRPAVRLSFSFHSPERLAEAADRLVSAWRRRV